MTKSDNANDESINHEVLDLLDQISDKLWKGEFCPNTLKKEV